MTANHANQQYEELVKEIHLATDGDGVASDAASAGLWAMLERRRELEAELGIDGGRASAIHDRIAGDGEAG